MKRMSNATARRRLMEAKSKMIKAMVENNVCSGGAVMDRCVKIIKDVDFVIAKLK